VAQHVVRMWDSEENIFIFLSKHAKNSGHLRELCVNWRMLLKLCLKVYCVRLCNAFIWLWCSEYLGGVKIEELLA
jgi:hypothetical protein